MKKALDRFFQISAHGSTIRTELMAAWSTFAAMAYIICVQPALLAGHLTGTETGMPFGPLLTTTCLASAIGCFLMGFLANYPIGLAPGVGSNFFLVFGILGSCAAITGAAPGSAVVWQTALAVIFVSGILFLVVSFTPIRRVIIDSLSPSIKNAIVAGLGLFIAYLGLKNGGIIGIEGGNPVLKASFTSPSTIVFFCGVILTAALLRRKVQGAVLYGILFSAVVSYCLGTLKFNGVVGIPENPLPVIGKLDFGNLGRHFFQFIPLIFICFFMDLFDTMGTLLGVATSAGLIKDGKIARVERVFAADATATVTGALLGHGTVTSFVESSAGTEVGGRTGLTAVFIGILFLLSLVFTPLIAALGACPAITASALAVVGAIMFRAAKDIEWSDTTEAIPATLIIGGISFTSSIVGGIAMGLVVYPLIKLFDGRIKETTWFTWLTAILLGIYLTLMTK